MGLKLAMVDDDEPSRIQLKWQMHQWSLAQSETYQMQPFTDGKAFLYEIEDGTVFDIVFIAERLNGEQMGGLKLAKRMREMAYKGALVILADTIDPEAKAIIKKTRFRKNFRLALHGWMEYHIAAMEISTQSFLSNPAGKEAKKLLEMNFNPRQTKKGRVSQ